MNAYSTGNSIVDAMISIQLTGNVIPQMWYKTITRDNGKPHLLAITLLADIVYWYRPKEIRDEKTGQLVGYQTRIAEDLFQRSYDQFASMFGETKRTITDAIVRLERIGVIRRVFRTVDFNGSRYNNVLYIELFPERLYELTYPGIDTLTKKCDRCHGGRKQVPQNNDRATPQECKSTPQKTGEGTPKNVRQITKNNTEITTEIISSSPKPPSQDEEADDDDDIKARVGYQRASEEYPTIARIALEELVKDNNRKLPITENMFLSVCRNVEEHSGEIANVSAYVGTCLNNIVVGHEISKSPPKRNAFSCFSQTKYSDREWEQLEEQLLAN